MIIKAQDYNVEIGPIAESNLQSFLTENNTYSSFFILVDENTHEHCLSYIMYQISGLGRAQILEIPSGEENKTLEICYQIWQTLTENNADRNALLINLGGGVIGDMGGFIASTYKRGIDFINIPTTILSQVDASIGGKVAIDLDGFKNQIGLFSNPKAVFIDSAFLETLKDRQIKSGLAEMLKHGLIADKSHWERLNKNLLENYSELVIDSIQIKNQIVLKDPKEIGVRKMLNFGHTIGHAVETNMLNTKAQLLHGEAVAIGIICESYLSKNIGLNNKEYNEICSSIKSTYNLPLIDENTFDALLDLMQNDKKNQNGKLNFTLLESIGKGKTNNYISEEEVKKSLIEYNLVVGV